MGEITSYPQGSVEWHRARIGRPTASQFHRIATPKEGKPSSQARRYQCDLIYERLFKRPWEKFIPGREPVAVKEGIESEPWAAKQFTVETGLELQSVGHVLAKGGRYGGSPDRLIKGKNEVLEIKAPTAPVHIGYLLDGPDADYRSQVQGLLLVGGWERAHFYSYHAEIAAKHVVFERDAEFINKLAQLLEAFCDELDNAEKMVRELGVWPKNLPSVFPEEDRQ